MSRLCGVAQGDGGKQIQEHMTRAAERCPDNGDAAPYIGTMFTLGALCPLAAIFAKKDPAIFNRIMMDNQTSHESQQQIWGLINRETVVFAALATAYSFERGDTKTIATSWGPAAFIPVLEVWQKIFPDRKPDDFIDPQLLSAIKRELEDGEKPLNQFLKNRSGSLPPSTNSIN